MPARNTKRTSRSKMHQGEGKRRQSRAAELASRRPHGRKRFWHGGKPGLQPGTVLVGRDEAADGGFDLTIYDQQPGYALGLTSPRRVYFTSEREFARAFAGQIEIQDEISGVVIRRGSLYLVEPIGAIESDPDFPGEVSWCAPQARILRVEEEDVALNAYGVAERLGPHIPWMDGSPVYSKTGHYLPSPEQIAAIPEHPLFKVLLPWTPVKFVNAWLGGTPSGDRPDSARFPAILHTAREGGEVLLRHVQRATALLRDHIAFSMSSYPMYERINGLLAQTSHVHLAHNDERGVVVAEHLTDGIIAVIVFTVTAFNEHLVMLIDTVAVTPGWRRCGIGSVLLLTAQKVLPARPSFVAGHCRQDVTPFFAQAGYTVLRPGALMPMPISKEPPLVDVGAEECWFYRQSPV